MKLLFDQNLSFKLCQALVDLFPGSSQVRLLGLAEADDRSVWQHAKANAFVLVFTVSMPLRTTDGHGLTRILEEAASYWLQRNASRLREGLEN